MRVAMTDSIKGITPQGEAFINQKVSSKCYLPKPKRNKMEIYNDILRAINNVELANGEAKPTRVQVYSNLAYDKLVKYLNELESREMIVLYPLKVTEKGQDFLKDYERVKDFLLTMGVKYLDISERELYEH
jgi:predicted transcriptional regulator